MRPLTAISIAAGTFLTMAMAAHAQFSSGIPGIEHAEAQVVTAGRFDNFAPLAQDWQTSTSAGPQIDYVTSEDEVRSIVGQVASSADAPSVQVQAQIAQAVDVSAPVVGDSDCGRAIAAAERKYGIPPHMLHAIALTESGREGQPYPWAMNIKGRAHYAGSPQEMVNIVNQHGTSSSIDIGCTQVNLKWHGHRFADWRSLIDPQTNADYAAYHLLELRREFGGWSKAVSAYHSRTSWRGANYACAVSRNYGRIFGDNRPGCGPDIEMLAARLTRT